MERGKSGLSLIEDRKKCVHTFEKRKKGLEKKAYELSTLCDVNVAMIMFGPQHPTIWPQDPNVVRKLIRLFQDKHKTAPNCSRNADNGRDVEKLMKQNIEEKYSYDQLLQLGDELDNVLQGLESRIDSMKSGQVFQESGNYHQLQGLNCFDSFGNEGGVVVDDSQTMKVMDEGSSYCDNSCNNVVGANLGYDCPSLSGFGQNLGQSDNTMIMGENSSYHDSYNNIVPCDFDFDYDCTSIPGFGEKFEQKNNNVVMDEQYQSSEYLSYTPAPVQMSEFKPCHLSGSGTNCSQMVQGDRSIDQIAGIFW